MMTRSVRRHAEVLAGDSIALMTSAIMAGGCAHTAPIEHTRADQQSTVSKSPDRDPKTFRQTIPSAAYTFEMLPIVGDSTHGIKPFWIAKTETTWDAFDVYVYRLDEQQPAQSSDAKTESPKSDAVTRPTKPYLPPDRGFGHEGFAAISMSHHNAEEFCKWLSQKSGRRYRLPTEQEWEWACRAGSSGESGLGDDVSTLGEYAWFKDNAEGVPHEVGKRKPNAWGLCDMHGNVAEWVDGRDGKPVLKGGSYRERAENLKIEARVPSDPAWNASDPQIPKSKWWLADAPFVGFRVVCEGPFESPATQGQSPKKEGTR